MTLKDRAYKRNLAKTLYQGGHFQDAAQMQMDLFNDTQEIDDLKTFAKYVIAGQDFKAGLEVLEILKKMLKGQLDIEIIQYYALCLTRTEQYNFALPFLTALLEQKPNDVNIHDGLSEVYYRLGDEEHSRYHGTCSLTLKDAQHRTKPLLHLDQLSIPPFVPTDKKRNIISYCLFGTNGLYRKGALQAINDAKRLYPNWTCRFYVDADVPERIQKILRLRGGEVIVQKKEDNPFSPLLWRFQVCNDPNVDRYLIRDCDSVISPREKTAVDEWLISDRHFHIMRDFATHSELILAGLWGGVRGALPDLEPIIKDYCDQNRPCKFMDQLFLRQKLWSTIKTSALIHDSRHRLPNTVDFPKGSEMVDKRYVGQRFDLFYKKVDV